MRQVFFGLFSRRGFFGALALGLLLFTGRVLADEGFRFAWLSDTHLGGGTGAEDLQRSVADLNSQTGLSFVVVSGDVTQFGFEQQYREAKALFDKLRLPCHIIPGNHDFKWSDNAGTLFSPIFGSERFVFDFGGFRFIGMHQGPVLKMGDGHFAPQDLRWLDETLGAVPKGQPIIFITHYPLDDGIDNWFAVVDRLKKFNTQAALVGHGHANLKMNFEGIPAAMGRSNLRAGKPVGGYTIVEIKGGVLKLTERILGQANKDPWHSIKLEKHDYASLTNKWPRPDFSINQRYPGVKVRWQHDTGWTIASSPAAARGLAVVGDASGTVRALALEDAKQRWEFKSAGPVYSTPAIADDRAVFASTDGNIYGLDVMSGKKVWQTTTDKPSVGVPLITNGIVYIGSSDRKFRALDLASGKTIWEFNELAGFVEARPLFYEGKVIFGAWDAYLYALDGKTGALAWKWIGESKSDLYSPAACWPVAAHGKVFVAAPDRKATAIDVATGKQVWRTGNWMVRESIGLSQDSERVYVRTMRGMIAALSSAATEPKAIWEMDGQFDYDINSAQLVEKEGLLFYGTKNGLLLVMDGKTGAVRWEQKLGNSILNTVVPLSAKQVLVSDFDGRVSCLEAN